MGSACPIHPSNLGVHDSVLASVRCGVSCYELVRRMRTAWRVGINGGELRRACFRSREVVPGRAGTGCPQRMCGVPVVITVRARRADVGLISLELAS